MSTIADTSPARTVGSFETTIAFDIVRSLEHAGIRTNITAVVGGYQVSVAERDYDRALNRI